MANKNSSGFAIQ